MLVQLKVSLSNILLYIFSEFKILNASNGIVTSKIKLDFNEFILECLFNASKDNSNGQFFIIISKSNDLGLNLQIFSSKNETHTRLKTLKFEFKAESKYKIALSKSELFFGKLLIESPEKSLKIYTINPFVKTNSNSINLNVDFLRLNSIGKNISSLIEQSCFSTNLKFLILFYDHRLFFFDCEANSLIAFKDFNKLDPTLEYFLSPTYILANKLTNLICIESKDNRYYNLICLNNLNCLIYLQLDNKLSKISVKCTSTFEKYLSFKISNSYLLGYNNLKSEIVGILLAEITTNYTFTKYAFKIKINSSEISSEHYGFSTDINNKYVYTLENRRLLKLFRFADCKKIAEILLPEFEKIVCSNEYICLALKDGSLRSYLICDPDESDSLEKIKRLESRIEPLKSQMRNECIENIIKDYSSSEESDDNDIIEKLSSVTKFKTKKNLRELECARNCEFITLLTLLYLLNR